MGPLGSFLVIALLIGLSAFFSAAEISLAAARRLRLRQMADEGDVRAERVLQIQRQPGDYVTVVQLGQNMVAILGGIVGEGTLTPALLPLLGADDDGRAQRADPHEEAHVPGARPRAARG